MLLLNPSPTRFATHFLLMMRTLCNNNAPRGTVHLQDFIELKLRKEEGIFAMIKDNQSFHQRQIFIKMSKPLLILMKMADSNQPHKYKLRFMVLMVDDQISISMSELNDEDYFLHVTELEDDENEEVPGDCGPPKYLSDDEYMYNNEDCVPSQDKNQLGGKILAVWDSYKPLL